MCQILLRISSYFLMFSHSGRTCLKITKHSKLRRNWKYNHYSRREVTYTEKRQKFPPCVTLVWEGLNNFQSFWLRARSPRWSAGVEKTKASESSQPSVALAGILPAARKRGSNSDKRRGAAHCFLMKWSVSGDIQDGNAGCLVKAQGRRRDDGEGGCE